MVAKNKRRKMPYFNQVGTHMITGSKSTKQVNKDAKTCNNCVHFKSGVCEVLSLRSGEKWFIRDKGLARKCKEFKNKYSQKVNTH